MRLFAITLLAVLTTGCNFRNPDDIKLEQQLRTRIKVLEAEVATNALADVMRLAEKNERMKSVTFGDGNTITLDTQSIGHDSFAGRSWITMWSKTTNKDGTIIRSLDAYDCNLRASKQIMVQAASYSSEILQGSAFNRTPWMIMTPETVGAWQIEVACNKG